MHWRQPARGVSKTRYNRLARQVFFMLSHLNFYVPICRSIADNVNQIRYAVSCQICVICYSTPVAKLPCADPPNFNPRYNTVCPAFSLNRITYQRSDDASQINR